MSHVKKLGNCNQPFSEKLQLAASDFAESFSHWRIFCMIGINDIRKRYTRSRLGQFWLTLSLAINIAALGFIWSHIFKIPAANYIPHLAIGIIFWTYISGCITEGAMVYISSTSYILELNIPKISYVNSLLTRNLMVFLHNLIVLVPIYCVSNIPLSFYGIALSLAGLTITTIALFPAVVTIGLFSLRFRDCPNIIASLMQIAFYVTPVMWGADLLSSKAQSYMVFNPFAVFLSLCRDPLMGTATPEIYWIAAGLYTVLGWLIAIPVFAKFRSRIVYWV